MVTELTFRFAALLTLAAAGCQAPGSGSVGSQGPSPREQGVSPDEFTLVFLRAGIDSAVLSDAEATSALNGHYDFMGRLAAQGTMLLAGQFGNNKATNDLRGLFVLDAASVDSAMAVAAQDPAAKLGIFRQEAFPLMAPGTLRDLPKMEVAFDAAREAEGQDVSLPVLADFVVMVAPDGKDAFRACTHEALAPKVLLLGRLGEPLDGALFGVFDASDPGEIRARMTVAGFEGEGLQLSQWLASPALRSLFQ